MTETRLTHNDLGQRARELYERVRAEVETPEKIGKHIVMDVASGDYAGEHWLATFAVYLLSTPAPAQ